VALHRLGRAVQERDLDAVRERIDAPSVRVSLLKQIVETGLQGLGSDLDPAGRRMATEAIVILADPLLRQLVTPEALTDLLGGHDRIAEATGTTSVAEGLRASSWSAAWRLFLQSEMHGFRAVWMGFPPHKPAIYRYRLRLQLSGGTWRLAAVELPQDVRRRLVQRLPMERLRAALDRKGKAGKNEEGGHGRPPDEGRDAP
jgi:hypothetical protein